MYWVPAMSYPVSTGTRARAAARCSRNLACQPERSVTSTPSITTAHPATSLSALSSVMPSRTVSVTAYGLMARTRSAATSAL